MSEPLSAALIHVTTRRHNHIGDCNGCRNVEAQLRNALAASERPPVDPLREAREAFVALAPPAVVSRIAVWRLLGGSDDDLPWLASPAAPRPEGPAVVWNEDKPHRCPGCHAVAIRSPERPQEGVTYRCETCGTKFRSPASPAAPRPEGLDVERLVAYLRRVVQEDTDSAAWRSGVGYAIDCIEAEAARLSDTGDTP